MKVKASDIYKQQNKVIHTGFAALALPYGEHKEDWVQLFCELCGRKNIRGLSDLTLSERKQLIAHLKKKGAGVSNPTLPNQLMDWHKGDADREANANYRTGYPGRPSNIDTTDRGPLLKKIEALLAEAKRPWSYADSIAKRMYGIYRIQWCEPEELHAIVGELMQDAIRHRRDTG